MDRLMAGGPRWFIAHRLSTVLFYAMPMPLWYWKMERSSNRGDHDVLLDLRESSWPARPTVVMMPGVSSMALIFSQGASVYRAESLRAGCFPFKCIFSLLSRHMPAPCPSFTSIESAPGLSDASSASSITAKPLCSCQCRKKWYSSAWKAH